MAHRLFTVSEANALVPFLEGHLRRLQELQRQAQAHFEEMEQIKAVGYKPDGKLILQRDFQDTRESFDRSVAEANARIADINRTGCQLKSVELGLVDFPSKIDEQEVLLCWKLGEDALRHYHTPLEGFDGRQLLPERSLPQESGDPNQSAG
ncbi:MAG: DUF2203 domain-containing protein [Thermaerobacter sp.]|nr:DUF2203 domain-containing protein [Thermaerobacter sp.]